MTRLHALTAAVLLTSCTSGPLEGGRYDCRFDGGDQEEACPGEWRCGLENSCHRKGDVSVAWKCFTGAQCERGYSCGLTDKRDAGECHDPNRPAPWPCSEDRHCAGDWHCGPEGVCYDRTVPAARACRQIPGGGDPDAGDCAGDWRCGLRERCQNTREGQPYACGLGDGGLDDVWCEQGWRCTPEGVCTDPSKDALRTAAPIALDGGRRINPVGSTSPIEHFTVSPQYLSGPGGGLQTTAYVQDGTLQAVVTDRRGQEPAVHYSLGAWQGALSVAALGSRGENGPDGINPDEVNRVFVALADAGLALHTLHADGGNSVEILDVGDPVTRLTIGSSHETFSPRVLGFTDPPIIYFRFGGEPMAAWSGVFRTDGIANYFDDDAGNRVVDLASVRPFEGTECIFAVDNRGLWVAQRSLVSAPTSTEDFEEVEVLAAFSNDSCRLPVGDPQRMTGLAPHGREWLGVSSSRIDGGQPSVSVLDLRGLWTRPGQYFKCTTFANNPCSLTDRIPVSNHFGPCPACPGGRLLDFAITLDSLGEPRIEARCGDLAGKTTGFSIISATGSACDTQVGDGEAGLFGRKDLVSPDQRVFGQVSWGGLDGNIWSGSSVGSVTALRFDRTAQTVATRGPLPSDMIAFTPEISGTPGPLGLETRANSKVVSGVMEEPSWVVTQDRVIRNLLGAGSVSAAAPIGSVGTSVTLFPPPYSAARVQVGAGKVLVVTAGSSLFASELGGASPALKVVSPSQIDSIAFPSRPVTGTYLSGYAVTPNGLLRLSADTSARWSFTPVSLPPTLSPLEVWFDGDRGRIGFADGTVYALPSRVLIARPLPVGDATAIDYAQTCGQQLMLNTEGLYRLEPVGQQKIGRWMKVELPAGFAPDGFSKARLHAMGSDFYVFTRTGEAARVSLAGCP